MLISCTEFQAIDRLQPFHVKISDQALAFADLHSNIISAECVGYISGQWNAEQNCKKPAKGTKNYKIDYLFSLTKV